MIFIKNGLKFHIKEGKRENVFINLVNFVFCYFIPYLICYCGSKITTEVSFITALWCLFLIVSIVVINDCCFQSNLLFRDAYNGLWYEHDLKAKKNLRTVMLGASKTLHLRYKTLAVFGMELFRSVCS